MYLASPDGVSTSYVKQANVISRARLHAKRLLSVPVHSCRLLAEVRQDRGAVPAAGKVVRSIQVKLLTLLSVGAGWLINGHRVKGRCH